MKRSCYPTLFALRSLSSSSSSRNCKKVVLTLGTNISNGGALIVNNYENNLVGQVQFLGLDYIKSALKAFSKNEQSVSVSETRVSKDTSNSNNSKNNSNNSNINGNNNSSVEKSKQQAGGFEEIVKNNNNNQFSKDKEYIKVESMEKKRRFENIINYYVLNCKKKQFTLPDRDFALYKFFLNAFSMIGQAHSALDCLNELKEKTHKPIPYNYCDIVIHSLLSSGREEEALSLLKDMERASNLVIGGPNRSTYNKFFEYYSKEGKLYPALSLLESVHKQYSIDKETKKKMKYEPVSPDFSMFKSALKLLTEHGKMKLASNCLYLMTKHYKIEANAPIYELFLNGSCNNGDVHSAKGYFESIKSLQNAGQANLNTLRLAYITYIKGLCDKGDMNTAEEILHEFNERKFKNEPILIAGFIQGHAKAGNIQAALDIYNNSRDASLPILPSAFATMINSFCKMGNFEMANRILDDAFGIFRGGKGGDEHLSYCSNFLLRGYLDAGKLTDASRLFERMKLSGQKITVHTYNSLINGFCKANNEQRAIEILGEMKATAHFQPDIYSVAPIIQSFLQTNNLENAQMFLDFATKKFNIKTNLHICCMFVQYGTIQRNGKIVDEYYLKGVEYAKKNSSENPLYFFNQTIHHHAIHGNVELCERVLVDMASIYTHPNSISYLYTSTAFALQSKFLECRRYLTKLSGISVDDKSNESLSLEELKFMFLKLNETKSFALANTFLYDCLLPVGMVDLDIIHIGMKLNIDALEKVQALYDSCMKFSIQPVRETDELLVKAKKLAEMDAVPTTAAEVSDFVKVVRY